MAASLSRRDHLIVLTFATCTRLLVCLGLYALPKLIPAFDASATILLGRAHHPLEGFLRWDGLHFARLAVHGDYEMEKDYAFMPGIWLVMRLSGRAVAWLRGHDLSVEDVVLGGIVCANTAGVLTALVFLRLSMALIRDRRFAMTAALLFCIPPAPQILSVPYTEPFYALISFSGMLLATRHQYAIASVAFAAASSFRANGFLNAGFIVWYLVIQPWHRLRGKSTRILGRAIPIVAYSSVATLPFLAVQYEAYTRFCTLKHSRPWCHRSLPLVYSYVQHHYWDVGFMRYWTMQQSPLFLLSAPVLILSFTASYWYYARAPRRALALSLPFLFTSPFQAAGTGFHSAALLPYIHLHTLLSLILLFASHVQICLRQASTNPVIFWFAAHLLLSNDGRQRKWGRRWTGYCVVWGGVAVLLWSGFYPPA